MISAVVSSLHAPAATSSDKLVSSAVEVNPSRQMTPGSLVTLQSPGIIRISRPEGCVNSVMGFGPAGAQR
jgi:hypothetical protein